MMINIVISNKNFDTKILNGLVIKSEVNANIVGIEFPREYEGENLENKIFVVKSINSNGVYFEEILPKKIEGNKIILTWKIGSEYTSVSGILKVAVFAQGTNYTLGTKTSNVLVENSPQFTTPLSPEDVFEKYLKEIRIRSEAATTAQNTAIAAKDTAVSSTKDAVAAKTAAIAAKDTAVSSAKDAVTAKDIAVSAKTDTEKARDIATNAADDAVKRMQAFEAGTIAAQVEMNKNEISGLKNYLKIERYGVKIAKSNSSPSGAMEYIYDAAGKQPAYMDFGNGKFNYGDWVDAFFIKQNRPVMLDASWKVMEELNISDQTKKKDGKPSSISNDASNLNAFAEFPQVWYKTWEDSTHQYFAVSNVQYDETYKCDVCKDAAGKIADKWYFPMFDGCLISGKMRSLADKEVSVSKTAAQEIEYCTLNGAGWHTLDKEQIHVFVMLAELISKNRNSQQAFGDQVSLATNTAGTNTGSLKTFGQFKGYNDGVHATKMFYCETGSLGYFMRYAGHVTNVDKAHLIKTCPPYNLTGEGYTNVGVVSGASGSYIKDMKFTEDGIFANLTGGSATTFWPDVVSFNSNCYALWRGGWNSAAPAGLRYVVVDNAASRTLSSIASALSGRKPV